MNKSKQYFNPIDTGVNFPDLEANTFSKWQKLKIPEKYLKKNSQSSKYFSFLDGPITANNPMGVHHAWGRTYKDLWQRFKNMQGFKQRFQNGFDCQGLWVEVEVEKELALKNKRDIENLIPGDKKASIAKFVDLCKERVKKYAQIQTEQSKRLGYFMDWDHSYFTMSEDNNYMIWHFLKVCSDNGWIYKGHDVVPWCPRCETAISQHETLTEDYKEVTHDSIFLQLPIKNRQKEFLLIWTTTPWTLPANTAVAVDENLEYSLVKIEDTNSFWVAKDLVEYVFKGKTKEVLKTVKGKELVGLQYSAPFDVLPINAKAYQDFPDKFHTVIATDSLLMPISTTDGTGLVHTSTSTGEEDHKVGRLRGLPVIPTINDSAEYLEGFGELEGKNAKKNPDLIFDFLKNLEQKDVKWIFAIMPYKHRYPACWRCKTELVWKVAEEWYIAMDKPDSKGKTLRQRMLDVAKKIKWIPEFGLDRELDWLNNMHDWLISKKNRYWGLALPIWVCEKCDLFEVIGSKEELRKQATKGLEQFEGHTPHKPWIDDVEIKCSQCGGVARRILDVGNPWLDAGIVAFSTISIDNQSHPLYWQDKNEWEKWYPANFITESFPGQFKNWFYSLIAMSTVLEDREPFKTVLGYGTLLAEDGRPMHKSWGNSIEFNEGADKIGVDVMRWLYCRQNPAENLLFGYRVADEIRRKFHFKLWNIYNYFITYANSDGWSPNNSPKLPNTSPNILDKWLFYRFNKSLKIVSNALENYDVQSAAFEIENFVDDFSNWYIRRSRERTGTTKFSIEDQNVFYNTTYYILVELTKVLAPFIPYLADTIYCNLTKKDSVHLEDWPEYQTEVDDDLILNMDNIRNIVEKVHAIRKEKQIPVRQPLASLIIKAPYELMFSELISLIKGEVNVKKVEWQKIAYKDVQLVLDTRITPELEEEAKTRLLIRQIQQSRKDNGVSLNQHVHVTTPWIPETTELVERIKTSTLTDTLTKGEFKIIEI